MIALLLALVAAFGMHVAIGGRPARRHRTARTRATDERSPAQRRRQHRRRGLITGAAIGMAVALVVVPGPVTVAVGAVLGAATVAAADERRREARRLQIAEAWPRVIEDIRLQTTSRGRPVPQALLEAGARAPEVLRPAFAAAQREWSVSTEFGRVVAVLKAGCDDPTADATLETLLVAHEVGGNGINRRLEALVADRLTDLNARRDAQARQSGVRFARTFTIVVPIGMAVAGSSIGGRAAYTSPTGQVAVAAAAGLTALCWWWAGRLLLMPAEERVFTR